ncbi:hypothetical protein HanRHA438_Chr09g0385501 [Helianthus annuus]|nr:hypothetical protein HanRHA438_Chr09g0385501 [Helianthus annuus]
MKNYHQLVVHLSSLLCLKSMTLLGSMTLGLLILSVRSLKLFQKFWPIGLNVLLVPLYRKRCHLFLKIGI